MNTSQSIGIWGLGKVGKAYLSLFTQRGFKKIGILDKRSLTQEETELLATLQVQFFEESKDRNTFLDNHDFILPSPGVDIRPYYAHYQHKFLNELDLFFSWWPYPITAITGSVGKTTVTHLIGECLRYHGNKIAVGGNIGTATAELLLSTDHYGDGAVLEVSSFQLEHTRTFAPQIAIWTTFVPNHLDRHSTQEEYFRAKYQIIAHQQNNGIAIVPACVAQEIRITIKNKRPLHIIHTKNEAINFPLLTGDILWSLHNNKIMRQEVEKKEEMVLDLTSIPPLTFSDNLIAVTATLLLHGLTPRQIQEALSYCSLPAHRLEYLGCKRGILFYNDSKSTTPSSTLAAVQQLEQKPIILLLGGLSKGVDRMPLVQTLHNHVKTVICFGAERQQLSAWCIEFGIPTAQATTLTQAFNLAIEHSTLGDIILLSPGGSSYDLFTDYQERGNHFKNLVTQF